MNTNDMMAEIRDANLSYLMLAQQMIRADKACRHLPSWHQRGDRST